MQNVPHSQAGIEILLKFVLVTTRQNVLQLKVRLYHSLLSIDQMPPWFAEKEREIVKVVSLETEQEYKV